MDLHDGSHFNRNETLWTEIEDSQYMCNMFEKLMLQKCKNQCLAGILMIIHQETMKLAGTRSGKPGKALFLNKKGRKKGAKLIFKNFQHAMLWGVYPEVPKKGEKWW